jgi:hypothetical protein
MNSELRIQDSEWRFQILLEHDETLLNSESWLLNRSEAEFATNGSPKDKGEARSNSLKRHEK